MALGNLNGRMEAFMKACSLITTYMESALIYGVMKENSLETGGIIKCMEKEGSLGKMEDLMKGSIPKTKNMDLGSFCGLMAECMKECGIMENSMEGESIPAAAGARKESGAMEKGLRCSIRKWKLLNMMIILLEKFEFFGNGEDDGIL